MPRGTFVEIAPGAIVTELAFKETCEKYGFKTSWEEFKKNLDDDIVEKLISDKRIKHPDSH